MDADVYTVLTPVGTLTATYGPEDDDGGFEPVQWAGAAEAMDYLRMVALGCTDARGASIDIDRVSPDTLEHFCAPDGSGIVVVPPPDLLLERAAQKDFDNVLPTFQGAKPLVGLGDGENKGTNAVLDSAQPAKSAIEKLQEIRAARAAFRK